MKRFPDFCTVWLDVLLRPDCPPILSGIGEILIWSKDALLQVMLQGYQIQPVLWLQLLEGSLCDSCIQSQQCMGTSCKMLKNCPNHFFMHCLQCHIHFIPFKYGQGVDILGWLETLRLPLTLSLAVFLVASVKHSLNVKLWDFYAGKHMIFWGHRVNQFCTKCTSYIKIIF